MKYSKPFKVVLCENSIKLDLESLYLFIGYLPPLWGNMPL